MTDETSEPKKKGGWPKGKPRLRKTPLQAKGPVERPSGTRWNLAAGANWETNDIQHAEGVDRLHIPKSDIPEGADLMWVVDSVLGQPQPQHRGQFERKGWTPVHQKDFGGLYDGRFMSKGVPGEINVDGLVLMVRPIELTMKSREREKRQAREQVRIKEQALFGGDLPGVTLSPDHPSARASNRINKTVERIAIPQDDE